MEAENNQDFIDEITKSMEKLDYKTEKEQKAFLAGATAAYYAIMKLTFGKRPAEK